MNNDPGSDQVERVALDSVPPEVRAALPAGALRVLDALPDAGLVSSDGQSMTDPRANRSIR